jgi:heme exporter protein A
VSLHLALDHVRIDRGERTLIADLSAAFAPGDFIAVTGPNGAGKTSLLRAIAGLLPLAGGAIRLRDARAAEAEIGPEAIHLLSHRDGLKGALDARAHLAFWRHALGPADGADDAAALARVGLGHVGDLAVRAFSQGMGRRLALARLLVAPRPLWLLDEPTASLDSAGKALVCDLIQAHLDEGGIALAALHEPLSLAAAHAISVGPQ